MLGKEKKRAEKAATSTPPSEVTTFSGNRAEELRIALEKIRAEPPPASTAEKENYFMSQAGLGEQLCTQGAPVHSPHFFFPIDVGNVRSRICPTCCPRVLQGSPCLPFTCGVDHALPNHTSCRSIFCKYIIDHHIKKLYL